MNTTLQHTAVTELPLDFTVNIPIWRFSPDYIAKQPDCMAPLIRSLYKLFPSITEANMLNPSTITINEHKYRLEPAFTYALVLQWRIGAREKLSDYRELGIRLVRLD